MFLNYSDSPLEKWLVKKNMSTKEFVEIIGCSRIIIWKAKRGRKISSLYALKIRDATQGEVLPRFNEYK